VEARPKVFEVTAPVVLIAAAGFVWARRGFEFPVDFITRLMMNVCMPALVFVALTQSALGPGALSQIALAAAAAYGVLWCLIWALVRLLGLKQRTYLAPLVFGNTGNLGLPLALFAFGTEGLGLAVVVFAVMLLWNFTLGVWAVAGDSDPGRPLREPILWASIGGMAALVLGWQPPVWAANTLDLIGQPAIPLMLFTLGVAMARLGTRQIGRAAGLSMLRLATCLAVGVGAGTLFGLGPVPFAVLVLQIATPVAVTSYLLAQRFGADADAVAGLVIASTLLSIATLPALIALLI